MFLVLWGVALCRLLIPVSIPLRYSVYSAIGEIAKIAPANTVIQSAIENVLSTGDPAASTAGTPGIAEQMPQAAQGQFFDMAPATIVWLAGMLIAFVVFAVVYFKNHRELRFALIVRDNDFLNRWLAEHRLLRPIAILQSDRIATPVAASLVTPRIILPKSMNMENEQLLNYVLTHEYYHIRRYDALWKLLCAFALCIHWFNPLVWVMFVLVNRDLEITCDEMVLHHFGAESKTAYAYSLIGMAEQRSKFAPLYNSFSRNATEERIVSIMKIKKTSLAGILLAVVLVAGTTTAFATSGVNAAADGKDATEVPNVDGSGFSWDIDALTDGNDVVVFDEATMPLPIYNVPELQKIVGNLAPGRIFTSNATFAIAEGQLVTFSGSWSTDFQNFDVGLYDTVSGEYTWFSCSGGVLENYTLAAEHDSVAYKLAFRNPPTNIYDTNYSITSYAVVA
jgi:beta-lactamase regulating signal transducer with metallopeptidase domain